MSLSHDGRVVAVLGPTNTGKTHLAVERMLGHKSGMIGLPLRLLAREVYDRIVRQRGDRAVALITGEERIMPAQPTYFVCTVEAMPLTRRVDFLAVDEIQLAADPERGHVFTSRLLRARGERETMFLGSDSMLPMLRRLLPGADFLSRPRFSELSCIGERKLSRLPRRSAIVGFSANDVYAIAELVRRHRGGAAVIMGALSPRTRNAQVALYQSGEVDYLVATDAIGMGLNMDVDHVAFAGLRKFDGRSHRPLSAAELGQIAGRAGRHMNDGTFGTTANCEPLDDGIVELVTQHTFEPVRQLQWRNDSPSFSSLSALVHSLRQSPQNDTLVRSRDADDQIALEMMARQSDVVDRARGPASVRQLWDVCRIPDFVKASSDTHHRLLQRIYFHLTSQHSRLPEDWIARHVKRLDRIDGDIDTLAGRIAHIRTWTYITHRSDWLDKSRYWQERSRAVEDSLSDALHAALTQRFVDRRTAVLYRSLKEQRDLFAAVTADDDVLVEGQYVGKLRGMQFHPDAAAAGAEGRSIRAAANRVLGREVAKRAAELVDAADDSISWKDDNCLWWRSAPVARLARGHDMLHPLIDLIPVERLHGPLREQVRRRLVRWVETTVSRELAPLVRLRALTLSGPARGLAFQLVESLGVLPRQRVNSMAHELSPGDRRQLRESGVRLGYQDVFIASLLRPGKTEIRLKLWAAHHGQDEVPPAPPPGRVRIEANAKDDDVTALSGFRRVGDYAYRIDILDRLGRMAQSAVRTGPFEISHDMQSLIGSSSADVAVILRRLGYIAETDGDRELYRKNPKAKRPKKRPVRAKNRTNEHSPFAELQRLRRNS